MDVLREWLAPTMIREIGAMMQSITGAPGSSDPPDGNTYSDDGSNLRARSFKPGVVQITKLYATDGPMKMVISDSYTMVRATIASSATTKHASTKKKQITKDTLGGLIQILDFEIVATHLGARSERATILINDFKIIGSEGSGAFGCPRPLESLPEVVELLDRLKISRTRGTQGSQPRSRLGSQMEGSPANSPLDGISHEASQSIFATQIPSGFSERPLRAGGGVQQDGIKDSTRRKSEDTTDEIYATDAQTKTGRLSAKLKEKTNGKRNVNSAEALLGLLASKQPVNRPASKQIITKKPNVAQSHKSEEEPLPTLPEVKNKSASEAAVDEVGSGTTNNDSKDIHKLGVELENSTARDPAAQPLSKPNFSPGHQRRDSPPSHIEYASEEHHDPSHSGEEVDREVVTQVRKPFKRICSADIRISKDQQILLDRQDSWLPAEPGQRGPVANVPIATLQALNHRADLAVQRSSLSPDRQHQEGVDDAANSLAHRLSPGLSTTIKDGYESEMPISSAEWPPSSPFEQPRDELPPDSSMESIEHPRSGNGEDLNRSNHASQSQPHLETSASSTPTRSSQRKPKQTSKALQIAARSSPSLMSGSADEEAKRFKCREPGCNKAYVGASGLRYHMEHVHNSVQPKGSSSRTRVQKSKNRDKYKVLTYICARCYNHFDTEAEIIHHENLDSCSPPQNGLLQERVHPGIDIDRAPTNPENPSTTPFQSNKIVDLREGKQKDGPSSVVGRLGEPSPISPGLTYVSPYASPRQSERLITSSRSSPKSISKRHIELKPNLPHSTPPLRDAMVPLPDGKWSKGARSDISSVDSELETTVPHALNEAKDLHVNSAPMQRFPSTATQPEEPFTQVKRTPYVNGRLNTKVHSHPGLHAFPVNGSMNDPQFIESTKEIERGVPPQPSTPPISAIQKHQVNPGKTHPAQANTTIVDEVMMAPQFQAEIAARSPTSRSVSPMRKHNFSHFEDIMLRSTSVSTSSESILHRDDLSVTGARGDSGLKRNSFEPVPLSPHVAKRRKHARVSTAFKFSQDVQAAQDPSILARAYRQEFLASRKSSTSEQSDVSRRVTGSPGKGSDSLFQHSNQIDVVQNGNPKSKLEADQVPAHTNPLQSAPSPVENVPLVTNRVPDQLVISGNDKDVVTTIENQDNPVYIESLLSEGQGNVVCGASESLSAHQSNDTDNSVNHHKLRKYEEPSVFFESASTNAREVQTSKTEEKAPLLLSANDRGEETKLDSDSTSRNLGNDTEINSKAASFGGQDGQGFLSQVNASLSLGQESYLGINGDSLVKFPTQAPEIVGRAKGRGEGSTQPPEVAEIAEVPGQVNGAVSPQNKLVDQPPPRAPLTVFESFKIAYPEYKGNEQRFIAICKKINALVQQDRMEHRSLWDDFIIRHIMEYSQYLQTCAENAEDPVPYERFYRNEIEDPRFTKRIVTPKNLREILGIGDQEDNVISPQQQPQRLSSQLHSTNSKDLFPQRPTQQRILQSSRNADLQDASPTPASKSPPKPASIAASSPKQSVPQATVDLTKDSDDEELIRSPKKTCRSLPWKEITRDVSRSTSPARGPRPRRSTSAHSFSTPHGPTFKGLPRFKETRLANPDSKSGIANSSPLPRTSIRLKPQFSQKFGRGAQDASTPSSKRASFSRQGSFSKRDSSFRRDSFSKPITIDDRQDTILLERDSGPDANNNTGDKKGEAAKLKHDAKDASWKDPHSPFKQFAKAYTAVRPAKGNSFAIDKARQEAREKVKHTVKEMEKEKAKAKVKVGEKEAAKDTARAREKGVGTQTRHKGHWDLNILDWHL